MEIQAVYLKALILDCRDPVGILVQSKLRSEREDEQIARNILLRYFEKRAEFTPAEHAPLLAAMRFLGVDVPEGEIVSVIA